MAPKQNNLACLSQNLRDATSYKMQAGYKKLHTSALDPDFEKSQKGFFMNSQKIKH
jgi:hypothetical protein